MSTGRTLYRRTCRDRKGLALMPWVASEVVALGNRASIRSRFRLSRIARVLPGLETKHAFGVGLETLAPYGVISDLRPSGHSYVGHQTSTPSLSACQCRAACLRTTTLQPRALSVRNYEA